MSEASNHNWELLPNNPVEFFQLEPGFDRTALKRAYNRLIKLYKPDKFPEEFQRIRAAYEKLDDSLRYGLQSLYPKELAFRDAPVRSEISSAINDASKNSNDSSTYPSQFKTSPSIERVNDDSAQDLDLQSLLKLGPEVTYKRFRDIANKTPSEYRTCAILSEVVQHPEHTFEGWLLEGLRRHPGDSTLTCLFRAYNVGEPSDAATLTERIRRLSETIRDAKYYFVAEPLWRRLSDESGWSAFAQVFDEIESKRRELPCYEKHAFLIGIVTRCMFRAPLEWLKTQQHQLDRNCEEMRGLDESEVEFTSRLVRFREQAHLLQSRGRFGREIVESVKSFCELGADDAHESIVKLQHRIASEPRAFLEEIQSEHHDSNGAFHVWGWITASALARIEPDDQARQNSDSCEAVLAMLRNIDQSFPGWRMSMFGWINIVFFAIVFILIWFVVLLVVPYELLQAIGIFNLRGGPSGLVTLLWWAFVIIASRFIFKPVRLLMIQKFFSWQVRPFYSKRMRSVIARTLAATHLDWFTLNHSVNRVIDSEPGKLSVSTWLPHLLPSDTGLYLYSLAVRFQR
jgi:hypothetical protein